MNSSEKPLVLNVDDNEAGRYATTRMLLKGGFAVLEAATGNQALELAHEHPDLILLDVNLPDLDGFEVCRRLKTDPDMARIPVVYLSATHRESAFVVEGLDIGGDGYLTQPLEGDVLIATVRAAMRARRAEELARAAAAQLQAVLELLPSAACVLDTDDRVICSNAAFVRMSENAAGGPALDVRAPELASALATLRELLAPKTVELHDGPRRVQLQPVLDETGVYQGAALIIGD